MISVAICFCIGINLSSARLDIHVKFRVPVLAEMYSASVDECVGVLCNDDTHMISMPFAVNKLPDIDLCV